MGKQLTAEQLKELIEKSIKSLNTYLQNQKNGNSSEKKKAGLLAYWITDYVKFLSKERKFDSTKLLKYNRGDIVSVDFGYRIGSELGGRHFAFVLDNYNSMKSNIVTVVPFTSKKEQNKNGYYSYELKHGLFELHKKKLDETAEICKNDLSVLLKELNDATEEQLNVLEQKIKKLNTKIAEVRALQNAVEKLNDGTVVNLGQITTVCKMRILNPKHSSDSLNRIKLNAEDLDEINKKLIDLYFAPPKAKNDSFFDAFKSGLDSRK